MFDGFDIHDLIARYGYGLVSLVVCLESMGLPLPGESLMIATALYAAATGKISIAWVVLAAAVGAIMGDNLGFAIGRRVGPPVLRRYGPRIGLTLPRQRLAQFLFLRHGGKVVFLGRFVAFLRTFAAVLAGANRMEWGRFLVWNALGGITWTCLYGFGAYLLGSQVHRLAGPFGIATGIIAAGVLVRGVLFVHRHERRLLLEAEVEMQAHEAAMAARQ